MKKILNIVLIVLSQVSFGQDTQNKLSFEFGFDFNSYKMGDLNEFFIDSFATKPTVNILEDRITSGQHFQLGLAYKPIGLFEIGVYGGYQYGNSKSKVGFIETNDWGAPIKTVEGTYELKTEAINVGLSTAWYVSHLLKFQEKENLLKRFHFGVELKAGLGFSKVTADMLYPSIPLSTYTFWKSQDFQGQIGIKAEYDLTQSPLFTSLGLRFGYQYFKTKTVKDRLGDEWISGGEYPMNLDFSGLYFGVYLKLGR